VDVDNNDALFELRHGKPPCGCDDEACKKTITQKADVSIPVAIKPAADVGDIEAECVGEPQVTKDMCHESCKITVTQTISVRIPIRYSVTTDVGESEVNCHNS